MRVVPALVSDLVASELARQRQGLPHDARDDAREEQRMLTTALALPGALLRPYVWRYGQSEGRIDEADLVVPLPARPKQVLTFFFRDRYRVRLCDSGRSELCPTAVVVGPQTYHRADLLVRGRIDAFTIHLQPAAFHHLFGVPMPSLADAAHDARDVLGAEADGWERRLADAGTFEARVLVAERLLATCVGRVGPLDQVGAAAGRLFECDGAARIADLALRAGLGARQFERRFLTQVGVPPKLYARIVRFNAAVDRKLASPGRTWTSIAHELDYHDQMHMVHDFGALAGDSPSRFLARISAAPGFATAFAAAHSGRSGSRRTPIASRSY